MRFRPRLTRSVPALAILTGLAIVALFVGVVATGARAGASPPIGTISIVASAMDPWQTAGGPDGNVWFTNHLDNTVGRITPGGVVTNFRGAGIDQPTGITAGPDGNVWFTNMHGNSIGRVTPAGVVSSFTGAGIDGPQDIVTGSDGNLWFTNWFGHTIGRITPSGTVTNFSDPAMNLPHSIAAGSDGSLWFTNYGNGNPDSIGRITTAGVLTVFTGGGTVVAPGDIAAGSDGRLWYVNANLTIGAMTTTGTAANFSTSPNGANGITAGADGNLWFTSSAGGMSRMSTSGAVTAYSGWGVTNTGGPAAGPDGNVWFSNNGGQSIGRVTPAGATTVFKGSGIRTPEGIATGPDGNVWFTNFGNSSIGRVTPTGSVANFTSTAMGRPSGIVAGPDGNLWFTNRGGNSIGQITPAGVISKFTGVGVSAPRGITAGPDGNLWFVNQGNNSIGRITTAGVISNFTGSGISAPWGIAAGSDGNLWFTNSSNSSIGQITTAGVVTNFTAAGLISAPHGIAAGPDGNLWFTSSGSVGRITPAGVVTKFTAAGLGRAEGITAGPDGNLWFTNTTGTAAIGSVTVAGVISTVADPNVTSPLAIAAGSDGKLWFVDGAAYGLLGSVALPGVGSPGAPGTVAAAPGDGQATVAWTAPSSVGGSAITGYVVTPYIGAVAQAPHSFGPTPTGRYITGLTNGTTYSFEVVAVNGSGPGPATMSGPITVGAPTAPGFVAAKPGDGAANLSWWAPATNGSPLTGYVVTPYIGAAAQTPVTFPAPANAVTVPGLTNGTSYTFRIAAQNANGTGPSSATASVVVGAPSAVPAASAKSGDGSASVSWSAPASNGSPITGYTVTPYLGTVAQAPQTFASTATTQTVAGLTNGSTYSFRVAAINARGTGATATAAAVTVGTPLAPAFPKAQRGDTTAKLSWWAPAANGSPITQYVITPYVGSTALTPQVFNAPASSATVTGLTNGSTYTFKIAAKNARGTGAASTTAPIMIGVVPDAPFGVSGTPGTGQVTLSWFAGPAHGMTITGYVVTPYIAGVAQAPRTFNTNATTQVIGGLTGGTAYTFSVAARNAIGTGPTSSSSSPVTPT